MKTRVPLAALVLLGTLATVAYATSTYTTHYELAKPADGDSYGEAIRDNMDTVDEQMFATASSLTTHLTNTTTAHAATAITTTGGTNLCPSSTTVQAYLDCLDATLDPSVSNVVLLTGSQTITGTKTFSATPIFSDETTGVMVTDSGGAISSTTTPDIGTPSAGVLTNATGLPISTGLTGDGAGVLAWLATPSSANLITAVTDETGTGALVFGTAPTITLDNGTGLPIATGVSGLGSGVATFLATPTSANLVSAVTNETGTGALVFGTAPTITLDNGTGLPISTGVSGLGAGVGTFLATPTSANLISAVTDETGSGLLVFGTAPVITLANGTGLPISTGVSGLAAGVAAALAAPSSANIAAAVTDETGSGSLVFGTAPTITLDNGTGLPISTGVSGLGSGVASFLATPTSANLITAVTNETGTGALVFGTAPTITLANGTGLPISTGVSGLGTGVATVLATPSSSNLAAAVTDETGSGALVFGTAPTITLANGTGLPVSTGISGLGSGIATALATPSSANLISAVTDETGTGALVFGTAPTITLANGTGLPISTGVSGLGSNVATFLATATSANLGAAISDESGSGVLIFGTSPQFTTNVDFLAAAQTRYYNVASSHYVGFKGPNSVADKIWTLPLVDGSANQTLVTDGSGTLSWASDLTASLNQYNLNIGDSTNTAVSTNTNLLGDVKSSTASATVTITNATPAVVSHTAHGLATGDRVYFTTSGALPTGLSASTTYWIIKVDANSYNVSTTEANAYAGTKIATSSAGSGTHTAFTGGLTPLKIQRLQSTQYYGSLPEVGGSTPFQLVDGNKRIQVITSTAANTIKLPTTSIKAGEMVEIHLTNQSGTATIQSSDGSALIVLYQGFARFIATQDTPTAAAGWYLMEIHDNNFFSSTCTESTHWTKTVNMTWSRTGSALDQTITLSIPDLTANATATMTSYINLDFSNMPAGIRPKNLISFPSLGYNNAALTTPTRFDLPTSGDGQLYGSNAGSGNFACLNTQTCGQLAVAFSWVH